jgi:hypothetical protein
MFGEDLINTGCCLYWQGAWTWKGQHWQLFDQSPNMEAKSFTAQIIAKELHRPITMTDPGSL